MLLLRVHPGLAQRIFTAVFGFSVFMALGDLMFLTRGVLDGNWGSVVFGVVGLLICWGYGATAWRGRRVMRKLRRRSAGH
ncbi:MAG: hypothetical protein AAF663_12985, partial [Planctomycetota bacterium]